METKIQSVLDKFKNEYGLKLMVEDKDLSLYGFTNIHNIDGVCFATLKPSGFKGPAFVFYRILNPIHYHHLEKLGRIRKALNNPEYKNKLSKDKSQRVIDWFRKIHTEVYKRDLNFW